MKRLLVLLLLILIAAKAVAALALGPVGIEQDAFGYWRLASLVLSGDVLMMGEPIAFRTPIYPWFVATIRAFAGPRSLMTLVAMQGLLYVATAWIAGRLAYSLTRLPWAVPLTLAASLPAISSLTFSAAVLSETLFTFLLMVHLLSVAHYAKCGTWQAALLAAFTFALTLLTRPIVILLWLPHLVLVLWMQTQLWWNSRRVRLRRPLRMRHRVGHAAIAAGLVLACCSPWLLRNVSLFGAARLTEFVGRNVWIVTYQDGSGAGLELPESEAASTLRRRLANVDESDNWRDTWSVSDALVRSGLSDAQADRLMQQVASETIRQHPKAFATKAFRRVVNFWRCAATELPAQGGDQNYRGQPAWRYAVPPVDWAIEYRASQSVWLNTLLTALIGAANLGLILHRPTRPFGTWLLLVMSYFAVVTGVLEIPAYRYRVVIEPLAAATLGAAGAVALSRRRKPAKLEAA